MNCVQEEESKIQVLSLTLPTQQGRKICHRLGRHCTFSGIRELT